MMVLLALTAMADPTALRAVDPTPLVINGDTQRIGVATWIKRVGLAVSYGWPAGAIELSVGTRGPFVDMGKNWSFGGQIAGGAMVTVQDPSFALALSPAIGFSFRPERFAMDLNIVSPAEIRLVNGIQGRIPVLGEAWWVWELGPGETRAYLGFGGRLGPSFNPGLDTSIEFEGSIVLGFGPSRQPTGQ